MTQTTQQQSITPEMMASLDNYINKLQSNSDHKFQSEYPNTWAAGNAPLFEYNIGKRWVKVIDRDGQGGSVFCFIDPISGDIYKPAGWNAPAKGKRGNINDDNPPLTSGSLYK
jgi:hypothetical protein